MKIEETRLCGCYILKPEVFFDSRGLFFESLRLDDFERQLKKEIDFTQYSHSRSKKGVLRGLHYQKNKPQGKLVSVVRGEIFDVVVDIRKNSSTFGEWESFRLSDKNFHQLWIPPGFAHGFCVLTRLADITYKLTDYFDVEDAFSLNWADPDLNINWPATNPIMTDKDKNAPYLKNLKI